MIKDKILYFVIDYNDNNNYTSEARVFAIDRSYNIYSLIEQNGTIKNDLGDIAKINFILLADNRESAFNIAKSWNDTYKQSNRFFGGN